MGALRKLGIGAVGLLVIVVLMGADWPTFLDNPGRSGVGTDTGVSTANAATLRTAWTYQTGGGIAASASVVNGVVYVGSWDGYEYALDAATGALRWRTFLGQTVAPKCTPSTIGVTSAAAVSNGVLYVGGGDSNWYALDAGSGAKLWSVPTGDNSASGGHYNWSSPLLYGGFAYIGVASNCDNPLVQGQLLQVDLSTQKVVNTFNVVPTGQTGGGIWTSPAIDAATNTIYVTTGTQVQSSQLYSEAILSLNASTLALKDHWQLPLNQQVSDSDWGDTPLLITDSQGRNLVEAINKNGVSYAWDRTNLAAGPVWQDQVAVGGQCPTCGDGSVSSGAFANGTAYVAGGNTTIKGAGTTGFVRAIDPGTGNFIWQHASPAPVVPAIAYDNGLVIDGAGPWLEVLDAGSGTRLFSSQLNSGIYAAPSVADGEVFVSSLNGTVYAFAPATPTVPAADPNCPTAYTCQDIGSPSPAGNESASNSPWTVSAGGTGIAGTTDSFRVISTTAAGDRQATAKVGPISGGNAAFAGLMARQANDPRAPFFAVNLTHAGTVTVQYRASFGGTTKTLNSIAAAAEPLSLMLYRSGDSFEAATSTDGTTYTLVPGTTVNIALPSSLMYGVDASSASSGASVTATITAPVIGAAGAPPVPVPPATPCPTGWSCADVGNPLVTGNQSLSGGTWSVVGAGSDISAVSDQYHFVWQTASGDTSISAHVASQTNSSATAKAGVMLRQSTDPGSPYYGVFVTPSSGVQVQYRSTQGLRTMSVAGPNGKAPEWLRAVRLGTQFTAYTSSDGNTWTAIASSTVNLSLTSALLDGMAVTSHSSGTASTATFDTVSITVPSGTSTCPNGWTCSDIGKPTPIGSESLSGGTWTLAGGGNDIWNGADQFHYVWQTLGTGGTVSAHVVSQTNSSAWAKAGVMLRASTDPGAADYGAYVTPGNGVVVQYRSVQGGTAAMKANPSGTVPAYLSVTDSNGSFTAYTSADGSTWTAIPGSTVSITFGSSMLAGLAVTSHNSSAASTVTMDSVSVTPTSMPNSCAAPWTCADIGNPTPTGSQSFSGNSVTVQGGGSDIFNAGDQFHYVWQSLSGNGSVSADITAQGNSSPSAKAGVMLRQSTSAGAPDYGLFVTPGNGLIVQYRGTQGGTTAMVANPAGGVPAFLMVSVSGSTFTAYTSSDGTTWTPIAGSTVTISMGSSPLLAGVAVTSHDSTTLSAVTAAALTVSNAAAPSGCPTGFTCGDLGAVQHAGSQSVSGNTWTVTGAGTDISGTADQFHFIWQSLAADGSVSARVDSQANTSVWAKAGVMLRASTDPSSPQYSALVTPGNGIIVEYRGTQGASTSRIAQVTGTAPAYVKVTRGGSTFSAYTSSDGTTWTLIPGSTITLAMSGSIFEGFAVTSHNGSTVCTVTADAVVTS